MNLIPLSDHVIIAPDMPQASGPIFIPDRFRDKSAEGIVISVGPGKLGKDGQRIPLDVKVGDRVLCNRASADPIRYDGKEYKVVSIRDVLAIL